jgi:hypothetical protein
MMMTKRKKEREEAEAEEAQQAQMAAYGYPMAQGGQYYQDPAMAAQMQAYQQQYQQMMTQQMQMQPQQYGYDQTGMAAEGQAYPAGDAYGAEYGQQAPEPTQPSIGEPITAATLAPGQAAADEGALPGMGIGEQPQLPPAADVEEAPEFPESPFASAETQTLEEELGEDAAVAEVPMEPAMEPEEPVVPEPDAELTGEPEPEVKAEGETEEKPPEPIEEKTGEKPEEKPEGEGEGEGGAKCGNCGAAVKEGWFLCPECKQPLI